MIPPAMGSIHIARLDTAEYKHSQPQIILLWKVYILKDPSSQSLNSNSSYPSLLSGDWNFSFYVC